MSGGRVTVARIGAAHGVRGEVRLKSYTGQPDDVAAYGPLRAAEIYAKITRHNARAMLRSLCRWLRLAGPQPATRTHSAETLR